MLLHNEKESLAWKVRAPDVSTKGEAADNEGVGAFLSDICCNSEALQEAAARGSVLRVEAFAWSNNEFVWLLCQFEPTDQEGMLRVHLSPTLPALAGEWDRELGRIHQAFEAARRCGDRGATQARDDSLRALVSRFSERLQLAAR